jgi:hypothetical protein
MAGSVKRYCEKKGGGYIRVAEYGDERCTVEFKRHDEDEPRSVSWTLDDAKRAGLLVKDNWKGYPADMLKARALTRAARIGWPDLLGGVYDPDEMTTVSHPETRSGRSTSTVTVTQPETPAIASPEISTDATPADEQALSILRDKAAEKNVTDRELWIIGWKQFDALKPSEVTVSQARDLFRALNKWTADEINDCKNDALKDFAGFVESIRAVARDRSLQDVEFDQIAWYRYGVGVPTDMTVAQADELLDEIRKGTDEEVSALAWESRRAANQYHDQLIAQEESQRAQQSGK